MKKIYLLLAVLTSTGLVHAGENPFKPEPKLKDAKVSTWNIGAGVTKKLLHANLEWVNPYGIAYAKAGVFINDDNEPGAQVGFRFPYYLTGTDQNGYYFGVYAGNLESVEVDGENFERLGAGIDLAYVLLNATRISTISVGIGAAEKIEGQNGGKKDIKPQLQFAYSLSFGAF